MLCCPLIATRRSTPVDYNLERLLNNASGEINKRMADCPAVELSGNDPSSDFKPN